MNLESKLLSGPNAGYCSSSDDDSDSGFRVVNDEDEHQANVMRQFGGSGNTGPKGVLNDFKEFREQSKLEREARDRAILEQARRGLLQGTKEERERAQKSEDEEEDEFELLKKRRLAELRKAAAGRMVEIQDKEQFLKATDSTQDMLMGVVLYEPEMEICERLSHICKVLAAEFPHVKFVRARSTLLGMSKDFTRNALPTLQFYSDGLLVGNFVKLHESLGMDYDAVKLRRFLRKNKISLVKGRPTTDSEYSDDELD